MSNKLLFNFLIPVLFFSLFSCKQKEEEKESNEVVTNQADEDFRPEFHFTPKENWMNDPNGMFYLNGTYHLFFQYYPKGNVWGPMHWGHATSQDMIVWEEQEIALAPDEKGYIFSGGGIVDTENTSGFGDGTTPPVIAMFTYHDPEGEKEGRDDFQTQGIAYSLDQGKTFTKYEGNPVIENPGIRDFRDPKITRDEVHDQWVMVLSADDQTLFYTSQNLKDWELASEFGRGLGAHGGVWECPDFIQMPVSGTQEKKWVLIQSLNPGAYNGGSGTQYFVGDFDGKTFTPHKSFQDLDENHDYWIDFGKDNYAGVTWSNIPKEDGRHLFIGWMSNWQYATVVPTETWRSAMTIPRELELKKTGETYRITSKPVKELETYKAEAIAKENIEIKTEAEILKQAETSLSPSVIEVEIAEFKEQDYIFYFKNNSGDILEFGYDAENANYYIDRSNSGITDFNEDFAAKRSVAPRISENENLKFTVILDHMSIEIFFDEGETVMTEIFFPNRPFSSFTAKAGEEFNIDKFKISQLNK
ncbi:glycoside hydrolase family 32 protein [Salegentibacter sp. HM20]